MEPSRLLKERTTHWIEKFLSGHHIQSRAGYCQQVVVGSGSYQKLSWSIKYLMISYILKLFVDDYQLECTDLFERTALFRNKAQCQSHTLQSKQKLPRKIATRCSFRFFIWSWALWLYNIFHWWWMDSSLCTLQPSNTRKLWIQSQSQGSSELPLIPTRLFIDTFRSKHFSVNVGCYLLGANTTHVRSVFCFEWKSEATL